MTVLSQTSQLEEAGVILKDTYLEAMQIHNEAKPSGHTPVECIGITPYPGFIDDLTATQIDRLNMPAATGFFPGMNGGRGSRLVKDGHHLAGLGGPKWRHKNRK